MQAVVLRQFGPPDVLKVEEVPTPVPRDGEILVAIQAASINPSDVKNVAGKMAGTTLPRIPGRDFAGVVAKGPADLLGKEVWGTGGDIGFTRDGSHAQFILLPNAGAALKPANLSMEAAASTALTFVAAYMALVLAAKITSGETAVIIGATGGTGSAAVQVAKSKGARVIGAVRSPDQFDAARKYGADEVLVSSVDFAQAVMKLTGKTGANVVFDTTGAMFSQSVEMAAMDGRIPIITAPPDGQAQVGLRTIYRHELRILGVDTRRKDTTACAKILAEMRQDFEAGHFSPRPCQTFPLSQAVQAYQQAEHGNDLANILLP
jgi:NADPH:quinone reductase